MPTRTLVVVASLQPTNHHLAQVVFDIPELRNRILYTFGGLQSPSAAAVVAATQLSDWEADSAAGDSWVDEGEAGQAAYRHAMSVLIYVIKRDVAHWRDPNPTNHPLWRADYFTAIEDEMTDSVAALVRQHAPDYAELARWNYLLGEGAACRSTAALMACWRPPKPCGVGLTIRYGRRALFEIARDACPPNEQPDPDWSKADIVRHILAH
jgi:hypothetical protein